MARRSVRRFRCRALQPFITPALIGFLGLLVYASFVLVYRLHIVSSFGKDKMGSNLRDKELDWREKEALKSVPSLLSKEVLDVINRTTTSSDSDPFRKKNLSKSRTEGGEVESSHEENQMVPDFGHGTWVGEGVHKLNDTTEKNLREERRVTRANDLMNDKTIRKFEKSAIDRSRSVYSAAIGNYSIWANEYRKGKNFKDMLRLMQDQIIMVRVYSTIAKMTKNIELHNELEQQLEKLELEEESTDMEGVIDMIRETGKILERASEELYECKLVTNKLRAMLHAVEEELVYTQTYLTFLSQLASKAVPNAIHCLTMHLNLEYHLLPVLMRTFPREENLENPKLYHYALFSDNVLAASVVVNSTVMNAEDSSRHVFHLVTDKFNFGAMSMWFLLNPPKDATIQVQKFEDFAWLNSSYSPVLRQLESEAIKKYYFKTERSESAESGAENLKYRYPKYISMLNHLRFYLPEMFPKLDKILFLDDDVVVQKDLAPLWSVDLQGNVNGAVETCGVTFHRFYTYLNFSNQHISERFDPKGCGWAYGMNIFDLKEWKKNNITETYHFWQNLNENRTLWKLGTLPPGLLTFYNLTKPLEKKWHLLRLGYDKEIDRKKIEKSAVIHFNGHRKPWTELGISKYQPYWAKYIHSEHPYILSCGQLE